jgi:hypothetical protein
MKGRQLAARVAVRHGKQFLMLFGLLGDAPMSTATYLRHMLMPFFFHLASATLRLRQTVSAVVSRVWPWTSVSKMDCKGGWISCFGNRKGFLIKDFSTPMM